MIGVLHPGEMGAELGRALRASGHAVGWIPRGRSDATRERARAAGLVELHDVRACRLLFSVAPPHAAEDVAREVAGFTGIYVDANAISPATAERVAAIVETAGAAYVDGGIIGPPPREPGTTRLYLSGARAPEVAELFGGSVVSARVVSAASALKMVYAAWTKGSAALLLAIREAAASLGVEAELAEEWRLSQPQLEAMAERAAASATAKGWRWKAEMEEIADTLEAAGQPRGFHAAAAELYDAWG